MHRQAEEGACPKFTSPPFCAFSWHLDVTKGPKELRDSGGQHRFPRLQARLEGKVQVTRIIPQPSLGSL